jgi:hypothetical protein
MVLKDIKYNNLKFKQLPPPIGGGKYPIHGASRLFFMIHLSLLHLA